MTALVTVDEIAARLREAARQPSATFSIPGTDWTVRIASLSVAVSGGDVEISLLPEPNLGRIEIRGRPVLVGRTAWRADRLWVSVDTPVLGDEIARWVEGQVRRAEPRSLQAIFGASTRFASGTLAKPVRELAIDREIRAGRLEPRTLAVIGPSIRLEALVGDTP